MAIHDYVISNANGASVRQDLNDALAAIVSNNSNATAPTTTYAYQWWADTTNEVMKLRNAANTDWITLYQLDGEYTNITLEAGTNSAPSLRFVSDTNTGIYSPGADQVAITTGGTARLYVGSTGSVGIGSTTFSSVSGISGAKLQVLGGTIIGNDGASSNGSGWLAFDSACAAPTTSKPVIYHKAGTGLGIKSDYEINFEIGANDAVKIDNSKRLLVGTSSATGVSFLQVQGNSSAAAGQGQLRLARGQAASSFGSGDFVGLIEFTDNSGGEYARIACQGDGAGNTNDYPGRLVFSTTPDGLSTPTERMRITNKGYFKATNDGSYVSATGSNHEFSQTDTGEWGLQVYHKASATGNYGIYINYPNRTPNNTGDHFLYCNDSTALRTSIRSNGGLANYSANNANLSDINTKKDISPAADTWNCIKEWEIVNYRYKDQPDDADLNLGVIAQQVAESCPEVITIFQEAKEAKPAVLDEEGNEVEPAQEAQPERLGVREQQMYWMAIKALQEAQVRIEALEAEVAALKAQ